MRRRTDNDLSLHSGNSYVLVARRHVHLLMGAALVGFVLAFASVMARASESREQTPAKTTRDKVYSKDQAAKGAAQFGTVCAPCHDPEKKTADKMPGPPLVGKESTSSRTGKTTRSARSTRRSSRRCRTTGRWC
jgi:mono/diheme cytochrome c family protein